ncbi:MAG: GGDEF domain-containing protein [Actinobacteria bacterium]|nr:GGDEF domain-containing protein [Actinomycetota bacterium]
MPGLASTTRRRRPRRTVHADAAPLAAAAFLLSAAALIYLSLAVPGYIRRDWAAAFALTGVPCIALGALLVRRGRLGRAGMVGVVLFGDVAIVLSGYASTDRHGTTAGALLSLPTLFTGTFLPPRWLKVQIAIAAGCAWAINVLVPAELGVHVIRTAVLVVACSCPSAIVVLLRRQLDRAVVTDPLTGLLNRRGLDAAFPSAVARARRSGLPVAVLLADVDHFKLINDELGHQAGDEVLRTVAAATAAAVRAEDVAVRFGGEELAVVLVAPADQVRAAAERIRRAVEQVDALRPVTVSIGAAWAAPDLDDPDLLDTLVRLADARMYEAKRAGRNRTVLPGPGGTDVGARLGS